jgi:hypothetical protein
MSPQRRMIHVMVSSARPVMCGEMGVQLADTMPEVTAGMGIGAGFGMGRRTRMMIAHLRVAARHLVSGRVREHREYQEYQRRSESIMTGRAAAAVHRHCTTRMAEARMTRGPASRMHRPAVAASLCAAIPAAADSCRVEAFGRTTHRISVVIVIISKLLGTGSIRSVATPRKRVCPCPCLPQSSPAHPKGKCFRPRRTRKRTRSRTGTDAGASSDSRSVPTSTEAASRQFGAGAAKASEALSPEDVFSICQDVLQLPKIDVLSPDPSLSFHRLKRISVGNESGAKAVVQQLAQALMDITKQDQQATQVALNRIMAKISDAPAPSPPQPPPPPPPPPPLSRGMDVTDPAFHVRDSGGLRVSAGHFGMQPTVSEPKPLPWQPTPPQNFNKCAMPPPPTSERGCGAQPWGIDQGSLMQQQLGLHPAPLHPGHHPAAHFGSLPHGQYPQHQIGMHGTGVLGYHPAQLARMQHPAHAGALGQHQSQQAVQHASTANLGQRAGVATHKMQPLPDAGLSGLKRRREAIPCKFFQHGRGVCHFGARCEFDHSVQSASGRANLPPPSPRPM